MYAKLDIPWIKCITDVLPTKSSNENIWAKYGEILVKTESAANTIAFCSRIKTERKTAIQWFILFLIVFITSHPQKPAVQ